MCITPEKKVANFDFNGRITIYLCIYIFFGKIIILFGENTKRWSLFLMHFMGFYFNRIWYPLLSYEHIFSRFETIFTIHFIIIFQTKSGTINLVIIRFILNKQQLPVFWFS